MAKSKGIKAERTPMVDTHNAARLSFDNVSVGADAVLGQVDAGWTTLEGTLNVGRAALASELVGASQEAFDRTVTYLRERKQFGKLIGEFQALQHRAADLYCELEVTRSAVLKALQTLDESFDKASAIVSVGEGARGHQRDARGAGRRADAWRHRDDRRIRHGLLHEARARMQRAVRRLRTTTPTASRGCIDIRPNP